MNLYLKPDEQKFIAMSVVSTLELVKDQSKNPLINYNPEARKIMKDMVAAGDALQTKLKNLGFDMRPLPPFIEGDEKNFLTKES